MRFSAGLRSNTVRISTSCHQIPARFQSTFRRSSDPLRVLFCGADEFSIASLRALKELHNVSSDTIASLDVVCRPDKFVGRGLKRVQEVPIKSVAQKLNLPIHQIDTFTGWTPPNPYNLVVAVSFGLLVPPRILNAAQYGGLNVHPSMLPDLRGAAPIQQTLLKERTHYGVSLQTMHPKHFDQGTVLAQTAYPGIPVPELCTSIQLRELIAPLGAEILKQGIQDGLFVPPLRDIRIGAEKHTPLDHAPKITPADRQIDWQTWTAEKLLLRDRVLDRLWDSSTWASCDQHGQNRPRRVTFSGPWVVRASSSDLRPGQPILVRGQSGQTQLALATVDRKMVIPSAATVEGSAKGKGLQSMMAMLMASGAAVVES